MKMVFLILVFAILVFRGGPFVGSLLLAIALTILLGIVLAIVARAAHKAKAAVPVPPTVTLPASRKRGKKGRVVVPKIADGDIGPYVRTMLERGDHEAVIRCIEEYVPGSWDARQDIVALVREHGRLQRSFHIATLAGVPMPDEAVGFSTEQIDLITDRARRMAFTHQHGAMSPRVEASVNRLMAGTTPLIVLSSTLRADLAESTANPQWGEMEERELVRKLERMSNTLQAMNSELALDPLAELDEPVSPSAKTALLASTMDTILTPREREVLALLAAGLSNPAIADTLFISERTVTTHLSRLYAKLDVSNRTEAIALAMRTGLVSPAVEQTQA